ncbi:MAG: hypothetical protein D6731_24590 [Planctomycetota bacterium]|nr:MAG: hypothetical protein D6731_24590 [Planctomycetota bacterium]
MDPYEALDRVLALPNLREETYRTPGAGASGRPFRVARAGDDEVVVRTSRGGRVTLRREAFAAALKVLSDLAPDDPEGWVRVSDPLLVSVLGGENRDKACTSYVLPLLEAASLVEIERRRPARARLRAPGHEGGQGYSGRNEAGPTA